MKPKIGLLFAIAATGLLAVGCSTTAHATRWEYKVVAGSRSDREWMKEDEEMLDKLGADGWQLVAFTDNNFWLKRRVK
jgi:hypothetical protein